MTWRLSQESPALVERLMAAGAAEQREAAVAFAELALRANGLLDDRTATLLGQVRRGELASVRTVAAELGHEADEVAFDAQDALDDRWGDEQAYFRAFKRARAYNALETAADDDPTAAALDAAYEAWAATDEMDRVEATLRDVLAADG